MDCRLSPHHDPDVLIWFCSRSMLELNFSNHDAHTEVSLFMLEDKSALRPSCLLIISLLDRSVHRVAFDVQRSLFPVGFFSRGNPPLLM